MIWYRPIYPGARPANDTGAVKPPTTTATPPFTVDNGLLGAATPAFTGGVTAPGPVPNKDTKLPAAAPFEAEFVVPS